MRKHWMKFKSCHMHPEHHSQMLNEAGMSTNMPCEPGFHDHDHHHHHHKHGKHGSPWARFNDLGCHGRHFKKHHFHGHKFLKRVKFHHHHGHCIVRNPDNHEHDHSCHGHHGCGFFWRLGQDEHRHDGESNQCTDAPREPHEASAPPEGEAEPREPHEASAPPDGEAEPSVSKE